MIKGQILGTAAGQFVGFAAIPVLTRLYSVDAFANFALVVYIANFLVVLFCFRYDSAILASESVAQISETRKEYFRHISMAVVIALAVCAGVYRLPLASFANVALFSVGIALTTSLLRINSATLLRQGKNKSASLSIFTTAALQSIFQLIFQFFGAMGLSIGRMMAELITIAMFRARQDADISLSNGGPKSRGFPTRLAKSTAQQLFYNGSHFLVLITSLVVLGPLAGVYALAYKLTYTPVFVISDALRKHLLQKRLSRDREAQRAVETTERIVLWLIPVLMMVLFCTPNSVPEFVLGSEWSWLFALSALILPWIGTCLLCTRAESVSFREGSVDSILLIEIACFGAICSNVIAAVFHPSPTAMFISVGIVTIRNFAVVITDLCKTKTLAVQEAPL